MLLTVFRFKIPDEVKDKGKIGSLLTTFNQAETCKGLNFIV